MLRIIACGLLDALKVFGMFALLMWVGWLLLAPAFAPDNSPKWVAYLWVSGWIGTVVGFCIFNRFYDARKETP